MMRISNYLFGSVAVALLFAGGQAVAQNPTLHTHNFVFQCQHLVDDGLIPPVFSQHIIQRTAPGVFPFDVPFDFDVFGTTTTVVISKTDPGNDFIMDWISGPGQPVAVIVSPLFDSALLRNGYIYDPTLPADTGLQDNGDVEGDATEIGFVKFC